LADLYQQGRNEAKLAEALGKVSELSPKDAKAAYEAAQAFRKIREKAKALEFLTRAVELRPQEAAYHKEYGLMLAESGHLAKAKASLLQADKKFPRNEDINEALYRIHMAENEKKEARGRMSALHAIRPASKVYAILLARLEADLGNTAEVAKLLSNPALRDTLDGPLSFLLLDAYFKTNQRDKAAALGPRLLQKYPQEAKKSLPLAVLFYEQKNRPRAKEILEAYTRENPDEEGFYYLGKIHFEEKNKATASRSGAAYRPASASRSIRRPPHACPPCHDTHDGDLRAHRRVLPDGADHAAAGLDGPAARRLCRARDPAGGRAADQRHDGQRADPLPRGGRS
jgi:predicted Zn-dependent protease